MDRDKAKSHIESTLALARVSSVEFGNAAAAIFDAAEFATLTFYANGIEPTAEAVAMLAIEIARNAKA